MYSYDLTTTYFRLNHTNNIFPKFKFTKEYVPLGDSVLMCLAANWADIEKGKSVGVMKPVQDFPNCSMAESGAIVWNELDPTNGVDIPVWTQHMYEAECSDAECDDYCASYYNGIFVDGVEKHVCYSYDVLDSICLVVEYDKQINEYKYVSGCFENGKVYKMIPAELNKVYLFKGIEIEIRDRSDPVIKAAEWSNYSFKYGNGFRYIAYLFNLILIADILFLAYIAYMIYTEKQGNNIKQQESLKENENADDF
jgi:hypothetical protein